MTEDFGKECSIVHLELMQSLRSKGHNSVNIAKLLQMNEVTVLANWAKPLPKRPKLHKLPEESPHYTKLRPIDEALKRLHDAGVYCKFDEKDGYMIRNETGRFIPIRTQEIFTKAGMSIPGSDRS